MESTTRSAFFYGTLMAPSVLRRVTNRPSIQVSDDPNVDSSLKVRHAVLSGFRRHRVEFCDYPAIVPVDPSSDSFAASQVRGTYVSGLTNTDVLRLDAFEGSEYERWAVNVRVLPVITRQTSSQDGEKQTQELSGAMRGGQPVEDQAQADEVDGEWMEAETYVWIGKPSDLEDQEWDFDNFVKNRLWLWAGGDPDPGFNDAQQVDVGKQTKENRAASDPTRGRSINAGEFEKKFEAVDT